MAVRTTRDRWPEVAAAIKELGSIQLMVGIPQATSVRQGPLGENNAAIGYVQEHGAPETNLPPRPFLVPGVASVQTETIKTLRLAAGYALDGNVAASQKALIATGLTAVSAVRRRIQAGIPPKLSERTIQGRERNGRGSQGTGGDHGANWAAGVAATASFGGWIPLIDTGSLLHSITFTLRRRGSRKDLLLGTALSGGQTGAAS